MACRYIFVRMKKILAVIVCLYGSYIHAQLPDSLRQHIDTAIEIMKTRSYYAAAVNWPAAKEKAYSLAAGAGNKAQLFPAIAGVFTQLGDHHGMFAQYDDMVRNTDSASVKRLTTAIKEEWSKGPVIKAEMLGDIAYLRLPGMPATSQKNIDFYANWLADSVRSLAGREPCAWIIDLRMNTGGNILPMMQGLAGFFPDGLLSWSLNNQGATTGSSVIRNNIFYLDDSLKANLRQPVPVLHHARVALIIGAGTASSAEAVAHYFRNRKNTKLFGEASCGLANFTEGFVFDNNNAYLLLVTSAITNPDKQLLPHIVTPHIHVTNNDHFTSLRTDNAIIAACKWIKSEK
jgi:hypothetical protein